MPEPRLELVIAPATDAVRDLRRNWRWIAVIAAVWVAYMLLSAGIACIWEDWSYYRSCYFTLINMTTVGFGDVTPSTPQTKILAGINSVFGLVAFGVFVASITMALQPASYEGSVGLTEFSRDDTDPDYSKSNDQRLAEEFVKGLAGLMQLSEKGRKEEENEPPHTIDIDIFVDGDGPGESRYIRLHIWSRTH